MTRIAPVAALVVAAAILLAPSAARADADVEVLGWSADGSLVYKYTYDNHGFGGTTYSETTMVILNPRTGDKEELHLAWQNGEEDGDTTDLKVVAESRKYETWAKSHPLKPAKPSRRSPDGKFAADVVLNGNSTGEWKEDTFGWTGIQEEHDEEEPAPAGGWPYKEGDSKLFLVAGSRKQLSADYVWGASGTIEPYWSPDGRSIAWVVEWSTGNAMNPQESATVVVRAAHGPFVEVLGDRSLDRSIIDKVVAALWRAGTLPTRTGETKIAREKTVVYATRELDVAARKLAAAVPGGAAVEPLTWKPEVDIVVVVGASAK